MALRDLLTRPLYRPSRAPAEPEQATYRLQPLNVAPELVQLTAYGDRGVAAIPAAYRGAQLLVDLCAQLPWAAWRGGKHSDQAAARTPERVDPTPQLLVDPSPHMDRDDAIRMLVGSLIWRGNAYLHLQLEGEFGPSPGRPRFATPVNPDEVRVRWNAKQTRRVYEWRGQEMMPGIDWLHVPFQRLPGALLGLGPFDAARFVVAGVAETNEWARRLFADSAVPSGVLNAPGKLDEDEADALRAQWERSHNGGRGTAVLSGGISYEQLSMTPEQAQFLGTRAWGVQEVARILGIPQHFLNAGNSPGSSQSLTYTNVQAVFRELTSVTLYPSYLRRIEAAFTSLLPRGTETQFELSEFLRPDDHTRYQALKVAVDAGIMSIDEARAKEDLPPLASAQAAPPTAPTPAPAEVEAEVLQ